MTSMTLLWVRWNYTAPMKRRYRKFGKNISAFGRFVRLRGGVYAYPARFHRMRYAKKRK
jgi:hypothetical protein